MTPVLEDAEINGRNASSGGIADAAGAPGHENLLDRPEIKAHNRSDLFTLDGSGGEGKEWTALALATQPGLKQATSGYDQWRSVQGPSLESQG
jgi:hypothetical protein